MTDTLNQITARNLRAAADLIDQHPDLPQPYITTSSTGRVNLSWYLTLSHVGGDDQKTDAAAIVRAIDGGWDRGGDDSTATWCQGRDGLSLLVQVDREQVCTRRVVGQETVTIPAKPAEPERTETRDVVEWDCQPLLAPETTAAPLAEAVTGA